MFYDDDLDTFVDNDDFAEDVVLDGVVVSAIFTYEEVLSDDGNRGQVFSRSPSLTIITSQAENIAVDQTVVRDNAEEYRVRSFFHNASGLTEVTLYK